MDVSKMASRYKVKMGPSLSSANLGAARDAADRKKSPAREGRSGSRGRSRSGSRETITPPDEPGTARTGRSAARHGTQEKLPGAPDPIPGEKKKKKRKKKPGAGSGDDAAIVPAKQSSLQQAMRAGAGMKGGISVVKQMSMLRAPGKQIAPRPADLPPMPAGEKEGADVNQKQALKELMIKFEHNQKQMAEAQRSLIEGRNSVFSGVSRLKMLCMLVGNNLMLIIFSFMIVLPLYALEPTFNGGLKVGGLIRADALNVVSAPDADNVEAVPISSSVGDSKLVLRPGGQGNSLLVLSHTETADAESGAFTMAVPGPMGGGLAIAAGALEAISFNQDEILLGHHYGVGNTIEVRKQLQISDKSISTKSADLRLAPAEAKNLLLMPSGNGIVAVQGRDLKIDDRFQVGPRPTYVENGGLLAYAGEVPTLRVDVSERKVTMGSIVDPTDTTLQGKSTFHGNLTVEHGDLNLVSGTLKLSNMNFGQVRSLSFNGDSALNGGLVQFFGNMQMRDSDDRQTVQVSATDGSISSTGNLRACRISQNPTADTECSRIELNGHVALGANFADEVSGGGLNILGTDSSGNSLGGRVDIVGGNTHMHALSARGNVLIGEFNASEIDVAGENLNLARKTTVEVFGGMRAESSTPGLFSLGVDPLMAIHPVERSLFFGGKLAATGNTSLNEKVTILAGVGPAEDGRLSSELRVMGTTHLDDAVHVMQHTLSVEGDATLSSHLNGTSLFINGELSLGLNLTETIITGVETRYSFVPDNSTNFTVPAEFLNMNQATHDAAVAVNHSFVYTVSSEVVPLPDRIIVNRHANFVVGGADGDMTSEGSIAISMDAALDAHVTLATNLDRLSAVFNESGNNTYLIIDPASVTVHGTASASERVRIAGDLTSSTFCADAPERPNTTNITLHLMAGFSNNTNESYPMLPCNHSFDLAGTMQTGNLMVNVSTHPFDKYGHELYALQDWDPGGYREEHPNLTSVSIFEHTRTSGGFRIKQSSELNLDGETTIRGSLRIIGADNSCFSEPCLNGATCHDQGAAGYYCECVELWRGDNCEAFQEACDELENDCAADANCAHTGPCTIAPEEVDGVVLRPCPGLTETNQIAKRNWKHECICPYGFDGSDYDRGFPAYTVNPEHVCTLSPSYSVLTGAVMPVWGDVSADWKRGGAVLPILYRYWAKEENPMFVRWDENGGDDTLGGEEQFMSTGELQAIKMAANPAVAEVFVKDYLEVQQRSTFSSYTRFGRERVLKEYVNSSIAPLRDTPDTAECVTEWDIRTMRRLWLCPDEGNVNNEGLVEATIYGKNHSYLAGDYYNPLFLDGRMDATLRANLICNDHILCKSKLLVEGELLCDQNYLHDNQTLRALANLTLGSYDGGAGSTVRVHGNLLADNGGYSNPFVASLSAGEVATAGTLAVVSNSTLAQAVTLGRSASNALTIHGSLRFNQPVNALTDVLVNATITSQTGSTLVRGTLVVNLSPPFLACFTAAPAVSKRSSPPTRAEQAADLMVHGDTIFVDVSAGVKAVGNLLVQSNAITKFSVQTWAQEVKSGNFTIQVGKDAACTAVLPLPFLLQDSALFCGPIEQVDVDCTGFIKTGTLVSNTLSIDTITGTTDGVGTTIERNLVEAGGFRVIQVDELEEMYVGSTEFGGVDVAGVKVLANHDTQQKALVSLALPEVEEMLAEINPLDPCNGFGNCTAVPRDATPDEMGVTLATLLNSGEAKGHCFLALKQPTLHCGLSHCCARDERRKALLQSKKAACLSLRCCCLPTGHMAVMDGSITTLSFMQVRPHGQGRPAFLL